MSDETSQEEQKTERFNMFMSPSEMKAIDDWAWENRVRSKSEAVRRLVQIGLYVLEAREAAMNERSQYKGLFNDFVDNLYDFLEETDAGEDKIAEFSIQLTDLIVAFKNISAEPHKLHAFESVMQGEKWDHVALDKLAVRTRELLSDKKFLEGVEAKMNAAIQNLSDPEETDE